MKLSEIFYSIQGEGKNVGTPSVFVRLALCNLRCVWCDTEYTWNWKKFDPQREIVEMSVEEVVREIQKHPCKNIVLTGGEPLLQQEELVSLMQRLRRDSYWFEVETNGTVFPKPAFDNLVDQYNCSPKLKSSANSLKERECRKTLLFFSKSQKATFKFVIKNQKDFSEAVRLIEKYKIHREKVYLMPEGKTVESLEVKRPWLIHFCKEQRFHFTDRLHIHLFGDRRGT